MTNNSIVCLLHTSYLFIVSDSRIISILLFHVLWRPLKQKNLYFVVMAWSSIRHRSVEAVIFWRSRGEYVQYARGNSSTLWSKRVMGGEATEPSKPESILKSEIFGFWLRWTWFMWRLVTSLKRAGDSKLIRTCDDCLSCLQVGRVTATEKRDPHVALKAHFKPLELCIWLPCPCQRFRMLILRRPMRRSSLARKGHTRRSVVSWISESRFWAHWIHRWSRSVVYGCWLKFVGIVCTSENAAEDCYWKVQTIRRTKARHRKCEANFCRITTSLTTPCCLESMKRMARMGRYGKGSKGE